MKKQLKVAKEIIEMNENMGLTGSLLLKMLEIDVHRESGDIDLVTNSMNLKINLPEGCKRIEGKITSDGSGLKYEYKNCTIDILYSPEKLEMINGIRCGSLSELLIAKRKYVQRNEHDQEKHKRDIRIIEKYMEIKNIKKPIIEKESVLDF